MPTTSFKAAAIALIIPGLAFATPAVSAVPIQAEQTAQTATYSPTMLDVTVEHKRHRNSRYKAHRGRGHRAYYRGSYRESNYEQPIYRNTRIWRGRDGRYYCRKENGTTGLLIGGAVGALIGNEVAGRGDRTLGAILGAAGGAILGRAIDRSNSRCR